MSHVKYQIDDVFSPREENGMVASRGEGGERRVATRLEVREVCRTGVLKGKFLLRFSVHVCNGRARRGHWRVSGSTSFEGVGGKLSLKKEFRPAVSSALPIFCFVFE